MVTVLITGNSKAKEGDYPELYEKIDDLPPGSTILIQNRPGIERLALNYARHLEEKRFTIIIYPRILGFKNRYGYMIRRNQVRVIWIFHENPYLTKYEKLQARAFRYQIPCHKFPSFSIKI